MSDSKKGEELIERMRAARGFMLPAFEYLCREDPELIERYEALKDHIMQKKGAFPEKYKELFISLAITVRDPSAKEGIRNHVRRALQLGATPAEVLETFELALAPCGMMVLMAGCTALKEVLDEGASPP